MGQSASENISGGSPDGTDDAIPVSESDVRQEGIVAGHEFLDCTFAIPVEGPAQVGIFEKVSRI